LENNSLGRAIGPMSHWDCKTPDLEASMKVENMFLEISIV